MRVTRRDVRLVRDIALSRVISRDQTIRLGYFGSVCRANARLKVLSDSGCLRVLSTPFYRQHLYTASRKAQDIVGERIAGLMLGRADSPRYVRHALAVTELRIALMRRNLTEWRFEAQARQSFLHDGELWEVRPDGLVLEDHRVLFLEADMGHVSRGKFSTKIRSYAAYWESGEFGLLYGTRTMHLLVATTSRGRKASLEALIPESAKGEMRVALFEELGAVVPGVWS